MHKEAAPGRYSPSNLRGRGPLYFLSILGPKRDPFWGAPVLSCVDLGYICAVADTDQCDVSPSTRSHHSSDHSFNYDRLELNMRRLAKDTSKTRFNSQHLHDSEKFEHRRHFVHTRQWRCRRPHTSWALPVGLFEKLQHVCVPLIGRTMRLNDSSS